MRAAILLCLALWAAALLACTATDDVNVAPSGAAPNASAAAPAGSAKKKKESPEDEAQHCVGCHLRDFEEVRNPPHVGKKPTTCGICHQQTGWHPDVLTHPWALTGKHEKADCFFCHEGTPPKFHGTTKKCFGCHAPDFEKPKFPEHAQFEKTCEDCHTTDAWKPTKPGHSREEVTHAPGTSPSSTPSAIPSAHATITPPHQPTAPKPTAPATATPTERPVPTVKPIPTPTTPPPQPTPDIHTGPSRR